MLPEEIPEDLRSLAVVDITDLGDGEAAWTRADALRVLAALAGTDQPVSSATVFEKTPWGFAPTEDAWYGDRRHNELDTDYARRTQMGARQFVTDHPLDPDTHLFVLGFPLSKDAA